MTISYNDYLAWLKNPNSNRCLLVVLKGYNKTTGLEETFCFSTKEYATKPTDTPRSWQFEPRLTKDGSPSLTRSIPFFGEKGDYQEGDIKLVNTDGRFDDWVVDAFEGRPIFKYLGDPSWSYADFTAYPFFTGVIERIGIETDVITIKIRDKMGILDAPIQQNTLTTGETNEPIPVSYGKVNNVTPRLINAASHQYQWHDGIVQSLDTVYDNGVSISFTANNATGTFTLTSQPAGTITCTGQGAKPSGTYLNTAAGIIYDILTRMGDPLNRLNANDIDSTSLNALPRYLIGLYISERENKLNVLERICASMRAAFTFDRNGKFKVVRFVDPNTQTAKYEITDLNIKATSLNIEQIKTPQWQTTLGYEKNYTVQNNLQTALTETRRAWLKESFRKAIATDAMVKSTHLNAENPKLMETCLDSLSDANTEATAIQAILGKQCFIATFIAVDKMFLYDPGDVIMLTHPRLRLQNGVKMQILHVTDYETTKETQVKAWFYYV